MAEYEITVPVGLGDQKSSVKLRVTGPPDATEDQIRQAAIAKVRKEESGAARLVLLRGLGYKKTGVGAFTDAITDESRGMRNVAKAPPGS